MIYRDACLSLCPNVYPPSDDSFLLADNIRIKAKDRVMDMGTGCGIQGIIASKMGGVVTSSDISEDSLECAKRNAELNNVDITFVKSDLFEDIKGVFDLIMFNPPYLPTDPLDYDDKLGKSWDGGKTGREVTDRFVNGLKEHLSEGGSALLVQSTISGPEKTLKTLKGFGLKYNAVDEKPIFFEMLYLYSIWH